MGKINYVQNQDTFEKKKFQPNIGQFGTTTIPGQNQIEGIKTMIRQGVKHVELHLNGLGKGGAGPFDVPGKYSAEARRSIMQLAKMNKQTLSVHASMSLGAGEGAFSGIGRGGFNDAQRLKMLSEGDETVKFAAESTKGGAIVMHINEQALGDLGVEKIQAKDRDNMYREDPFQESVLDKIKKFKRYQKNNKNTDKIKQEIKQELSELKYKQGDPVFLGDELTQVSRTEGFIDYDKLDQLNQEKKTKLFEKLEIEKTKKSEQLTHKEVTKIQNFFAKNNISQDFKEIQKQISFEYEDFALKEALKEGQVNTYEIDAKFHKKAQLFQIQTTKKQIKDLRRKAEIFKDKIKEVENLEKEEEEYLEKSKKITQKIHQQNFSDNEKKKMINQKNFYDAKLSELGNKSYSIKQLIGLQEYETIKNLDDVEHKTLKKIKDMEEKIKNIKSAPAKLTEKTSESLGFLGIKALKYQHDLKKKALKAKDQNLSQEERDKYRLYKDYDDIDIDNNPLYIAPEVMPQGFGLFANLDEIKELVIQSRKKFTTKLLEDPYFEEIRKDLGIKKGDQNSQKKVEKLAKNHIGATFDNAHAATYFKYFKPDEELVKKEKWDQMSQESRWEIYNKHLNKKAERLAKEGIIKHVHFNDTTSVDDDHILVGHGLYDVEDLQNRLRNAGIKEAFIVEAGGAKDHIKNVFQQLNANLTGSSYFGESQTSHNAGDWSSVRRIYEQKDTNEFGYGIQSSLTFDRSGQNRHLKRGSWSGIGFL